ncbi:hypothetical protein EDEG_02179 [Edhazardia aedis USNM 41457]|uniref:Uncharacterized protein n=1 Tax=Edhazardia aedis (strain USNM 41457) TaxID=1003232 RepID=J8ZUX6_EDHAE|nr:hypothetical protein EDEG_02179 [Edhazardia aedis USNM 41457]|eukprot:EJW03483.1 hypothetical protein EDEG_02179 [Edhazardia aedis USNM 41457]
MNLLAILDFLSVKEKEVIQVGLILTLYYTMNYTFAAEFFTPIFKSTINFIMSLVRPPTTFENGNNIFEIEYMTAVSLVFFLVVVVMLTIKQVISKLKLGSNFNFIHFFISLVIFLVWILHQIIQHILEIFDIKIDEYSDEITTIDIIYSQFLFVISVLVTYLGTRYFVSNIRPQSSIISNSKYYVGSALIPILTSIVSYMILEKGTPGFLYIENIPIIIIWYFYIRNNLCDNVYSIGMWNYQIIVILLQQIYVLIESLANLMCTKLNKMPLF